MHTIAVYDLAIDYKHVSAQAELVPATQRLPVQVGPDWRLRSREVLLTPSLRR